MKVAVAVIVDAQQRILVTQRPLHTPHGGYWEFPGGKLENNEPAERALIREIKEEVGLDIHQYQCLGQINHQYSDRHVELIIFLVTHFSGTATALEGQLGLKWLAKNELNHAEFPEANHEIFALIPEDLVL